METKFKNYRRESRDKNWGTYDEVLSFDQINTGSLLRIADSLEKIEKPYLQLIEEVEFYRNGFFRHRNERDRVRNQLAGTKAWSTRQKNKIQNLEARIKELEATNEGS